MSGMDEYNRLWQKRMEWQRIYDMCQECIQDADFEFGGSNSIKGDYDATAALRLLNGVYWDRENFWQGADAQAFGSKLGQLYTELKNSETVIIEALQEIADRIEEKCLEVNEELNECRENFNLGDQVLYAVNDLHKTKRTR